MHIIYSLYNIFLLLHKLLEVDFLFLLLYFPSRGKYFKYTHTHIYGSGILFYYLRHDVTFLDYKQLYLLLDKMQTPTLWEQKGIMELYFPILTKTTHTYNYYCAGDRYFLGFNTNTVSCKTDVYAGISYFPKHIQGFYF